MNKNNVSKSAKSSKSKSEAATKNTLLEAALALRKMGYSIIPIGSNKAPTVPTWKPFQEEQATEEQIRTWFSGTDNVAVGIGLVTGKKWGLFALDVEKEGLKQLKEIAIPLTPSSKTGGGGKHFFFQYPNFPLKNRTRFCPNMDIRADGGYVVVPPSAHPSGKSYKWIHDLKTPLAEAPTEILEALEKQPEREAYEHSAQYAIGESVNKGERNTAAASVAGQMYKRCGSKKQFKWARSIVHQWNKRWCNPPLSAAEIDSVCDSIEGYRKDDLENPLLGEATTEETATQKLLAVALAQVLLFQDELEEPYVQFPAKGYYQVYHCKNQNFFGLWLKKQIWDIDRKPIKNEQVKEVQETLAAKAIFGDLKNALGNRVVLSSNKKSIYYDLANDAGEIVEITNDGWKVSKQDQPIFRRTKHQNPQVTPSREGNPELIFKYVNLKNEEHKLLFLTLLMSYFIPDIPHPIALFHGQQGSAKSTAARVMIRTVDPSKSELVGFPSDEKELAQQLFQKWCIGFDNLDFINKNSADAVCRAVTGGAFEKRQLYTDAESIIFVMQRCIVMNGINVVSNRPDLLERSILFELMRVSEEGRKTERSLWEEFAEDLPHILGGIFDAVSMAMQHHKSIKLESTPRMADYAGWGAAIALSLGYKQEDFEKAYADNRKDQQAVVINEDSVANAVLCLMQDHDKWIGTAQELHAALELLTTDKLPKSGSNLSKQLKRVYPTLSEEGIHIEWKKDTDGRRGRFIHIVNNQVSLSSHSEESEEKHDNDLPF